MMPLGKIAMLGMLYFVQGLPYGFQEKFIPVFLRSNGLSYTGLSLMKLLLIPWFCKAAFAPVVDFVWTKQTWLLLSLFMLSLVSLFSALIIPDDMIELSLVLFLLNLFCATQDVSVDGLALQMLRKEEIGNGNAAQVIGYKLGSLFGGGVLFMVQLHLGWTGLSLCMALAYIVTSVIFVLGFPKLCQSKNIDITHTTFFHSNENFSQITEFHSKESSDLLAVGETFIKHNEAHKKFEKDLPTFHSDTTLGIKKWKDIFRQIAVTQGTWSIAIFVFIYKFGERGILSTFPVFLFDHRVTREELGFWNGILGQFASVAGSALGGLMLNNERSAQKVLRKWCILRTVPVLFLWTIVVLWQPETSGFLLTFLYYSSMMCSCILQLVGGIITTATFALMMSCSKHAPDHLQSTHYTTLSSLEVMGKLLFSSLLGAAIDQFGLSIMYLLMVILTSVIIPLIPRPIHEHTE